LQTHVKNGTVEKVLKLTATISLTNMHLFNNEFKITHYNNVKEILNEYYRIRLDAYRRRKIEILKKWQNDLDILKYRVKFVKQVIAEELEIRNQREEEVREQLMRNKYPELSLQYTEKPSYDYLTGMKIRVLTKEEIDKLTNEFIKKEAEVKKLTDTPETDIWLQELDEFVIEYEKWLVKISKDEKEATDLYENTQKPKRKRRVKPVEPKVESLIFVNNRIYFYRI
jgi:DNA topoisomerase II